MAKCRVALTEMEAALAEKAQNAQSSDSRDVTSVAHPMDIVCANRALIVFSMAMSAHHAGARPRDEMGRFSTDDYIFRTELNATCDEIVAGLIRSGTAPDTFTLNSLLEVKSLESFYAAYFTVLRFAKLGVQPESRTFLILVQSLHAQYWLKDESIGITCLNSSALSEKICKVANLASDHSVVINDTSRSILKVMGQLELFDSTYARRNETRLISASSTHLLHTQPIAP